MKKFFSNVFENVPELNCPNVLLQVGFIQSLVPSDLKLKYVSRFESMFTGLNQLTGQSAH